MAKYHNDNMAADETCLPYYLESQTVAWICFSQNILELNIYMRDLRVREYKQQEAFTLIDLLSKEHLHSIPKNNRSSAVFLTKHPYILVRHYGVRLDIQLI